jgi:hypothetical protein
MKSTLLRTLLFPLFALLVAASTWAAQGGHPARTNKLYIVQMAEMPVVAYDGGIPGLRATRAKKGQKIDPTSPDVVKYVGYLDSRHSEVVARAGGRKVYDYRYSFNGFAAELTPEQAEALKSVKGVVSVEKDEARSVTTATTPAFLGLTDPNGLWNLAGQGGGKAGEDIIIGLVDTGIWPEHPSFSDRVGANGNASQDGKLDYRQLPGWHGRCVPGDFFSAANCNQKLIGAQFFNGGWGGDAGIRAELPWEFVSPRDYSGHGSHTSSTAGGNRGVPATGLAAAFGTINGIAHRARIAMYKVCWETLDPTRGGCFNSDSVAAIDQAVADGVDVINFSIGGTSTNFRDSVEIAFLFAADAGVFVAASAGNDGPSNFTVAHPGPWLTTVAAGTHSRDGVGSATTGEPATYNGASVANPTAVLPFIDATAAGLSGADPVKVRLCYAAIDNVVAGVPTPVLDPAKIAGKIVLCDRGVTGRVNKSLAVKEAGGSGMILANTSSNTLNADLHAVPTVHVSHLDRPALKAYAATSNPTAKINASTIVSTAAAPFTATFSSRGPLLASSDLIKPDLIAPGQDILAAVAPPNNQGRLFDMYSGTSMSSPHVAGLAAILKNLHPNWSPMMIKSALMTTGYDVLDGGNPLPASVMAPVIFRQGAGHVKPNNANDPGLVFNTGFGDWLGFLCGTQLPASFCTDSGVPVLKPTDLNGASIAMSALAGTQTTKRRVTNVGPSGTYTVSVSGLVGYNVVVSPATFTINQGATQELDITVSRVDAPLNTYRGGFLKWSDGTHAVRIPALAAAVALAAPAQVSGSYDVKFGYTGAFTAAARGLIPATTNAGSVNGSNAADFDKDATDGTVKAFTVTIPAGTSYARFSLFDASVTAGSDLDLYVYDSTGTFVTLSGTSTSTEEANLLNPAPGTYTVYVHGFATTGASANFTLYSWLLGTADAGNMTVTAPPSATLGATGTIGLTFSSLTPGVKYLGSVAYTGPAGVTMPDPTLVRVDP